MNRRALLVAFALTIAAPALSIPPPPEIPISPQAAAAANALVAVLPVEASLDRGNYLLADGIVSFRVSDRLLTLFAAQRRLTCNREVLGEYLALRVAPHLRAALPEVARRFRETIAPSIGRSMTVEELAAAREIAQSSVGRSLLLNTWGDDLPASDSVAALFVSALRNEWESLRRVAEADCRAARGRPPARLL